MTGARLLPLVLLASTACGPATKSAGTQRSFAPSNVDVAIRARRILDPRSGRYSGPAVILVQAGRIADVIAPDRFDSTRAARTIDLGDATVLPGLIDAHVHLTIGGTIRANAAADLRAGFTTVADLGSRTTRFLAYRDSINDGAIEGPRVLAAGVWIGVKGGVCEFNGIGIAGGLDAYRARVRENVAAGANLIKACVSSWPQTAHDHPDDYELPDSVLAAIVGAAHAAGRRVIAHDISIGGVRAALRTGIDGLAHSAYLDAETARQLAARGVFLIPTLASLTANDSSDVARGLFAGTAEAYRAHVRIVFGTDGGVLPHGRNAEEFMALSRAGLSPLDAIRAATINAASALGIADSVGLISKGMSADLIAVDGDPLADLSVLSRIRGVFLRGRRQVPVTPTPPATLR
jgi:imidazolonepropionase-like amidohydrolase